MKNSLQKGCSGTGVKSGKIVPLVFNIAVMCAVFFAMFFSALIPPYDYVGTSYQRVNDVIDVLRIVWSAICAVNISLVFITRKYKKSFFIIYIVFAVFSAVKTVSLFLI